MLRPLPHRGDVVVLAALGFALAAMRGSALRLLLGAVSPPAPARGETAAVLEIRDER